MRAPVVVGLFAAAPFVSLVSLVACGGSEPKVAAGLVSPAQEVVLPPAPVALASAAASSAAPTSTPTPHEEAPPAPEPPPEDTPLVGLGSSQGFGGLGLTGTGGSGGTGPADIGLGSGSFGHSGIGGGVSRPSPTLRMGPIKLTGKLPPEVVQRIVRQNFGRFRLCYENGLRLNPTLGGTVAVKFVIGKDGAVRTFALDPSTTMADKGVSACVVRAIGQLSFPQPESGEVTVVYPIVFAPPAPPPPPPPPVKPAPSVKPAPARAAGSILNDRN